MWESIATMASTPITVVFALIIIIMLIVGIKKGWIRVNSSKVQIGNDSNTHQKITAQWEYVHSKIESIKFPAELMLNEYRTKYVLSRIEDEFQKIIIYNNIVSDKEYIALKQDIIYSKCMKYTENEFFRTEDFKEFVYNFVEEVLKELVNIKRLYSKS